MKLGTFLKPKIDRFFNDVFLPGGHYKYVLCQPKYYIYTFPKI